MKTKIICTIGPSSENIKILRQMIKSGMSIARINFSHGSYEDIKRRVKNIRKVSSILDKKITILADLQGPKIRIGKFKNNKVFLEVGRQFVLTTKDIYGDKNIVSVDYKLLPNYIKKNDKIFLDDGKIELLVLEVNKENIICKITKAG